MGHHPVDIDDDRRGQWMHTSLGGRFYPEDPRPEEVFMSDIANGLALDCRYAGQGSVANFYSVAEHSVHVAQYLRNQGHPEPIVFCGLLHDAPEAYINDLPKAAKEGAGAGYARMESRIHEAIWRKYGLLGWAAAARCFVKPADARICVNEKHAIMRHQQHWAADRLEPLEGVKIMCWGPERAKMNFLMEYILCCLNLGIEAEETEI